MITNFPEPSPDQLLSAGVWRTRWHREPMLVAGACLLGVIAIVLVLAPLLTSYDPLKQDLNQILQPPGGHHILGTDQLGRDVWARLLYAGRTDLQVGVIALIAPFVLGTILGCIAGYQGGWVDSVIMRLVDVVIAFPAYVLVIALVFVFGEGLKGIYIAIALTAWVAYARIARSGILVAKRQEYVLAARAGGLSAARIVGRHILPNIISLAIVYAMVDIVANILYVSTLSYLGLGVPPPTPEWGALIVDGQQFITTHPLLTVAPGAAIVISGLAFALIGDGVTRVLRPQ
jgi:peptide/nickel transport system permease protein